MQSELAACMRATIRAALPERAFLRRDRGRALYITNAPAFDPDVCAVEGFQVRRQDGLALIHPEPTWMSELEDAFPRATSDLSATLLRFRGWAATTEALELFCAGIKLQEMGKSAPEAEIEAFDRALRQMAARALRGGIAPGGLYALSLLDAMLKV